MGTRPIWINRSKLTKLENSNDSRIVLELDKITKTDYSEFHKN